MQAMSSQTSRQTANIQNNHNVVLSVLEQQHPLERKDTAAVDVAVVQWTSDATRREQYAEIDKRNRGLRKLLKKLLPNCLPKPTTLDFYNERDGSDAGSVRRYRIDLGNEKTEG